MDKKLIERAWKTFELREVCEELGLKLNKDGELERNG